MSDENERLRASDAPDLGRPARYVVGFDRVFGECIYSDQIFRVVPPKPECDGAGKELRVYR